MFDTKLAQLDQHVQEIRYAGRQEILSHAHESPRSSARADFGNTPA